MLIINMRRAAILPQIAVSLITVSMIGADSYQQEIELWRQQYAERLKAPDGWLSVAGLFWLHEGENSIGSDEKCDVVLPASYSAHNATLTLRGNTAVLHAGGGDQTLIAEKEPAQLGELSLALIERDHRFAIRMRDPNAETRKHFTGNRWFPLNPDLRIEAKWVPYDPPHTIAILSILGYVEEQATPGYAEFPLHGKTFRLEPIVEDPGELFFIFKDQTAGKETYAAGRFLKAKDPVDGKVILDFNRGYNPPCVFTPFATCPLPPKQNVLATRILAGELRYESH